MAKTLKLDEYTGVLVIDEPGAGGACHHYKVISKDNGSNLAVIYFQEGTIENGINGCTNEDLIAVVIDRLQGFQSGEYSCRENSIAITKLEEALLWLNKRTNDRVAGGVEGSWIIGGSQP